MVRLRENKFINHKKIKSNFNSSMVRLREFSIKKTTKTHMDFNSSMVRLRVKKSNPEGAGYTLISIPVWCD